MTAQVLFNQFAYADRLKRGGFTDDQARASAEALADALSETVATKSDIAELKTEIAGVRGEIGVVRAEMSALESGLRAEIATVRSDLKAEITAVRTEIAASKNDLIRWIFMLNIATAGLLFTAMKLFK
jgi:chromosome segregation ATPase